MTDKQLGPLAGDPADLSDLPYPELRGRMDRLGGELEDLIDANGLEGTDESRAAILGTAYRLAETRLALANKRERGLGQGSKHKPKGRGDDVLWQGDGGPDADEVD